MSEKKLTKGDRFNMFMRTNLQQASFNYERMHALGMCFDMIPAIKRLYETKEEQVAALKRHLTFFNVTPAAVGPVLGVTAAMEEAKANGADIDEGTIGSIKIGLMGPFCGVGDPIFWGTLRPITAAIGASLALTGSALGPVLFFLAFNIVRMAALYFGLEFGYKKGLDFVKHLWKDSWIPLLRQMPQKRRLRILPQERQLSKLLPLIQRKSLDQKEQVQKIMPILILLISASLEKLVKRLIWYLSMRRNMDIPGEVRSSGS